MKDIKDCMDQYMLTIEDIKLLLNDLDRQEKILSWEFNDLYTFLNQQQSKINKLEADKLELSKAIIEESVQYTNEGVEVCRHCGSNDKCKNLKHQEDCIVIKSSKYLGERSERD